MDILEKDILHSISTIREKSKRPDPESILSGSGLYKKKNVFWGTSLFVSTLRQNMFMSDMFLKKNFL